MGGGGGGGGKRAESAPPFIFLSITFEVFIVTPSKYVAVFPWQPLFAVSKYFFKMILYDKFYFLRIVKKKI